MFNFYELIFTESMMIISCALTSTASEYVMAHYLQDKIIIELMIVTLATGLSP